MIDSLPRALFLGKGLIISGTIIAVGLAFGTAWTTLSRRSHSINGQMIQETVSRDLLEQREGRFFRRGTSNLFTGWITDHFENGEVRLRSAVVDGRLHGISEGWTTNGVRNLREEFFDGQPHGPRVTWHDSGQKRSEGQLASGVQEGLYRLWNEDGTLSAEAFFAGGKPHGTSLLWYPSGFLKSEVVMERGTFRSRQDFQDGERPGPTIVANQDSP